MRGTIYFKNFMTTAVIVLSSFIFLGGLFSAWSYRTILTDKRQAMSTVARETLRYAVAQSRFYADDLSGVELRMFLSSTSQTSGFDLLIADAGGIIVSSSDQSFLGGKIGRAIPEYAANALLSGNSYTAQGTLDGVFDSPRYLIGSLIPNSSGAVLGYLFVSVDAGALTVMWRQFSGIFLLIAMTVLCLTFIVSLLTTRRQAEPLGEMARAARRFARGDFSVRVSLVRTGDELGELATAFNAMADAMARAEARRQELLANVSHELKTPMTVIAGFADGILDGTIPPKDEARYLAAISGETKRLSRLVRTLLDASRVDAPAAPPAPFDIGEVLVQTLLGLSSRLEDKRMDVLPDLPEERVFTDGDKDSITQVVYNLIDNAVKFAADGSQLRIGLWKQDGRAFVSVEDEGETIPEDEMPLIFDRFHKADKSRGLERDGVGLGLYIVKTILDHHNGDIFVTSHGGVTRFTFTLKLAQEHRAQKPSRTPPNQA